MSGLPAASSVCSRITERLAKFSGAEKFRLYFEPNARLRMQGDALAVAVPSSFCADWMARQFESGLLEAARSELGRDVVEIRWSVEPDAFPEDVDAKDDANLPTASTAATRAEGIPALRAAPDADGEAPPSPSAPDSPSVHAVGAVRPDWKGRSSSVERTTSAFRYELNEFVVGECNRVAYHMAAAFASNEASQSARVLFLYGECGVGKTHLLQGVAHGYARHCGGDRVRYTTSEHFANEFLAALQSHSLPSFRRRYRGVELLCIDDVHFLAGKAATQKEFFYTFQELEMSGARLVLASDAHPRDISDFGASLKSRCLGGVLCRLDLPDPLTRQEILARLAKRRRLLLDEDALRFLAGVCSGSVRDLEGMLNSVEVVARHVEGAPVPRPVKVSAALVRRVLSQSGSPNALQPRRPVQLDAIKSAVCQELGVEPADVLGKSRHRLVVLARGLIAFLARQLTTCSFPEIARALGRRNHSTIVAAARRIEARLAWESSNRADAAVRGVCVTELIERLTWVLMRQTRAA